jgi:hypothetical protein
MGVDGGERERGRAGGREEGERRNIVGHHVKFTFMHIYVATSTHRA